MMISAAVYLACGVAMAAERKTTTIAADHPYITYLGRIDFFDPKAPRFDWPGIAIKARFSGTSLGMRLADGGNDYNVRIDANAPAKLVTRDNVEYYELAAGLPDGEHAVEITKRTEGEPTIAVFKGFALDEGQSLLAPAARPSKRIEFIGDSITCGYGDEGAGECASIREFENNDLAFGPIVAKAVGAEYHIVAISKRGVVRNYNDKDMVSGDPMPYYYDRTLRGAARPKWDFSSWPADLVVIALGTNDFSTQPHPAPEVFRAGYKKLVQTVRAHYPGVKMLMLGHDFYGMDEPLKAIAAELKAEGVDVDYITLERFLADAAGCNHHPDASAQQKMAEVILPAVKAALGM